jgi:hypothetical protein
MCRYENVKEGYMAPLHFTPSKEKRKRETQVPA